MANHNATGRNHHPSKAERQQALALANKGNGQSHLSSVKQEEKTAKAPKTGPKTDPATRGNVTRERWSKAMKKRPEGTKQYMAADIKPLPSETIITAIGAGNPKKRGSADRYELYGFNGAIKATTTIGAYVKAIEAKGGENSTKSIAYGDIAWDMNHGFIELSIAEEKPKAEEPETKGDDAEVAATEAESAAA